MEDVYLALKRNVNGGVFGFVRHGNVKDNDKLLKAVNNVWFGDWRVVAKVATFDRFGNKKEAGRERGEGVKNIEGEKRKDGGGRGYVGEKSNDIEGEKRMDVGYAQVVRGVDSGNVPTEVVTAGKILVPKYTTKEQDVLWAHRGLVVTVLNGEAIPVLQRRIMMSVLKSWILFHWGRIRCCCVWKMIVMSVVF